MRKAMQKRSFLLLAAVVMAMMIFAVWGCEPDDGGSGDNDTFYDGPYDTTQDLSAGPSGESGLFYPSGSEAEGQTFPIFVWGCGAGSGPSDYTDHMNRIASHGFVVVAEVSSDSGTELTDALDWLVSENDDSSSPLYQMMDITGDSGDTGGCDGDTGGDTVSMTAAAGGHSRGSIGTFAIADDPRLNTTVHVAGGSFDGNGPNNLRNPAAYIAGEDDSMATSNVERDYRNTDVPVFMTVMDNVGHMDAAREGLPAIIAWLRWHLMDETERMDDFLSDDGVFATGMWDSKYKNWD